MIGEAAPPRAAAPEDGLQGLARQGLWNMAAVAVPGFYAVVLVALLLRTFGPQGYAPWAMAVALLGWVALLDAGLSTTTARDVARALAGDPDAPGRVRAANTAYALLAAAAIGLGLAFALLGPVLLGLRGLAAQDAVALGALLGLDLVMVIATAGWMGTLRGAGRFDRMVLVNIVQVAVALACLALFLPAFGIVGAALAQPLGRVAGRITAGVWAARLLPPHLLLPGRVGRPMLRTVAAFGLPILAIQVAGQLGVGSDVVVVGVLAGATSAGLYAAGVQLARYLQYFLYPAIATVFPRFAAAAFGAPEAIGPLLERSLVLAGLIGMSAFGSLAVHAPTVLETWIGRSDPLSVDVLRLYAAALALATPTHVITLMLIARGRHALVGAVILAEALVNLVLSVLLVILVGPAGAALSSLLVLALDAAIILPFVAARRLGVTRRRLLLNAARGQALGAGIVLLLAVPTLPGAGGLLLRAAATVALAGISLALLLRRWGRRSMDVARPAGRD